MAQKKVSKLKASQKIVQKHQERVLKFNEKGKKKKGKNNPQHHHHHHHHHHQKKKGGKGQKRATKNMSPRKKGESKGQEKTIHARLEAILCLQAAMRGHHTRQAMITRLSKRTHEKDDQKKSSLSVSLDSDDESLSSSSDSVSVTSTSSSNVSVSPVPQRRGPKAVEKLLPGFRERLAEFEGATGYRALVKAFKRVDVNRDRKLSRQEFANALEQWGIRVHWRELTPLFQLFDVDDSGSIDLKEFVDVIMQPREVTRKVKKRSFPKKHSSPKKHHLSHSDSDSGSGTEEFSDSSDGDSVASFSSVSPSSESITSSSSTNASF